MKNLQLFVALILSYVVALWVASALPAEPVRRNIAASMSYFEQAQNDPFYDYREPIFASHGYLNKATHIGPGIDQIMLNQAWNIDPAHPFTSPLECRMTEPANDSLPVVYGLSGLQAAVAGSDHTIGYERYWHGYLLLLRPLLEVADYLDIRRLNVFFLSLLAVAVVLLLARRHGIFAAGAFALAMIYANFWVVPLLMVYSTPFYLAFGASLIILLRPGVRADTLLLVVGSLTAFLDLLSTPLLTLGLPLAMLLIVRRDHFAGQRLWASIKELARPALFWVAGMAATWLVKGIIAGVVAEGGFAGFVAQAGHRLGADEGLGFWQLRARAIAYNGMTMLAQYLWGTLVVVAAMIAGVWTWGRRRMPSPLFWLWLMVAALPIGWYGIVANHSLLHSFMTYRLLLLSLWGVLMAWRELVELPDFSLGKS